MCRNIRTLFNFEPPVTEEEVRAASLQFVRKVTGFNKPSKVNEAAFLKAVDEITGVLRTPGLADKRAAEDREEEHQAQNEPRIDLRVTCQSRPSVSCG